MDSFDQMRRSLNAMQLEAPRVKPRALDNWSMVTYQLVLRNFRVHLGENNFLEELTRLLAGFSSEDSDPRDEGYFADGGR